MTQYINDILKHNNIDETWKELTTNGMANRIYATSNYILRIPTDHEEANNDARTESIAAPIAYEHGIKTPKLIAYDNSCKFIDRSYSIWERVAGKSLDQIGNNLQLQNVWMSLGFEIAKLNLNVKATYDPEYYLDNPNREYSGDSIFSVIKEKYSENSNALLMIIDHLLTPENFNYDNRFVHGDTHSGNIMCNSDLEYSALIDWGDSGWSDPVIDFYMIPVEVLHIVFTAYKQAANRIIDNGFISRMILDKIWTYMEENKDINEIVLMVKMLRDRIKKSS